MASPGRGRRLDGIGSGMAIELVVDHYYAVIMAGGGGTRLWPLSRRGRPKQSLRLLGGQTMFQTTVARIQPLF